MALQTSSARMACLFVPLWHFTRTIHISPYCTSIPVPFWHINYCAPTSTTHVRPLARLLRAHWHDSCAPVWQFSFSRDLARTQHTSSITNTMLPSSFAHNIQQHICCRLYLPAELSHLLQLSTRQTH